MLKNLKTSESSGRFKLEILTLVLNIIQINSLTCFSQMFSRAVKAIFIASLCFCFSSVSVLNRPTFQLFSWHTCLLGILSCLVMMFVINPVYSSGSIVLLLVLLLFLHYRSATSSWGYISQALIFHQVCCRHTHNTDTQITNQICSLSTVLSSVLV